ncbi:NAD-dependent epimerase/dehydratase family protein [Bacteroides reticulotermitis]|uniref:NAD-dependent epimerase/dehydratase family protein n=1 Tax=Bacteroides reticulotermitis TaxID=1133319 RepID=UPI003A8B9EDB
MDRKRVIVFGATGNLGAYTALQLKGDGYDVIAVGNRQSDNGFFSDYGIEYYSVDICDPTSFAKLPDSGIDVVVHFAGTLPSRYEYNPGLLIESITRGTLNVLAYMRKSGSKKIVFPQTPFDIWYLHNTETLIKADDKRTFPPTGDHSVYTIAKNAAVDLIENYHYEYGISRFILRFFTIYQYHPNPYHYANGVQKMMPYRILIDRAMRGEDIEIWGDPKRCKEIVYIKDFTRLVSLCVSSTNEGGIYNVGGNRVSLEEQIQGIIDVFSPIENPSRKIYCPNLGNSLLAGFDTSKTEKELGYTPQYSYLEAMRDFYQEMRTEPFAKLWGTSNDYNKTN